MHACRLSQEAEAFRRSELFRFVSEGDFMSVKKLIEDPASGVRATERFSSGGKSGAGLLHFCVTKSNVFDDEKARGRLDIVRYLLSLRSPTVDLGLIDEDGRTMLHVAAIHGDVNMLSCIIEYRTDPEKKIQQPIDLNARCLSHGWTPLHYAAVNGKLNACQILIQAGVLLNIHAHSIGSSRENDKGMTPLELVKHQLQEEKNQTMKNSLQAVCNELTAAIDKLESNRLQRDIDKSQKEAKAKAEKQRLAQKEQTERELLERKQKQLREKQEKERQKEEEDAQRM
jgi:ankyrin repeat protein